jgi:hypothetical protein
MQSTIEATTGFTDRRQFVHDVPPNAERRQFADGRDGTRPEVKELAEAVDQYKLRHRRRFITFEELYDVMASLGYRKA